MKARCRLRWVSVKESSLRLEWKRRGGGDGRTQRDFLDFIVDGQSLSSVVGDQISCLGWFVPGENAKAVRTLLLEEPADLPDNRRSLYVCPECGDIGCGVVSLVIERVDKQIIWRDFGYENNYDAVVHFEGFEEIGPFAFNADEYEKVIKQATLTYLNATLEELDGEDWGTPSYDSSLVKNCHRLRRVPLKDFRIEDLRIMIGQEIGLEYLLPLALVELEKDHLAEGDFYPGDLLKNVLGVSRAFWLQHPELKERMDAVVENAKTKLETLDESDELEAALKADLDSFLKQ